MHVHAELLIGDYLSMCDWYGSLPPMLRNLAYHFPPGSKWRLRGRVSPMSAIQIREGDYWCPESFNGTGSINLRLISGATGHPLALTYIARPKDLIPASS